MPETPVRRQGTAFYVTPDSAEHLEMRSVPKNVVSFCGRLGFFLLIEAAITGCFTLSRSLPPVNLTDPGWKVQQGQAVWTLPHAGHDIAGDVIVAIGPEGSSFVQFSKSPFPLVIGQITSNRWQIEFPPQNKSYSGPGRPPKRLMWLYLPWVLAGNPPPSHWTWTNSPGNWVLENHSAGEKIEGFFDQ